MLNPGLKDKVVIITGANNPYGIGAAVAKTFAEQKAKLFLHYFQSPATTRQTPQSNEPSTPGHTFYETQQQKSATEVLKTVHQLGAEGVAWEGDLTDPQNAINLFNQAEKTFGQVDILINNAAYSQGDTFLPAESDLPNKLVELWANRPKPINIASIDNHFAVNTRAPALLMAEFSRRHIARKAIWGRIINISTAGAYVFPSEISYGASKFALESYTRSAAVEFGQFGITVNTLSLGPIQTGWITPELATEIIPTIPMGRLGTPQDVAEAIILLTSNQAGWITGQKIYVGGGHGM